MKGTTLALEPYWDTGLTHKVPGCITQTKKTRGERKKAGQAKPGRPARGHAGWVDEGIAGKRHSLSKGEANPKSSGTHAPNLSKKLSQSLVCWISELWPKWVKVKSPKQVFPLSNPGLATKDNLSPLDKDNKIPFYSLSPSLPMRGEDSEEGSGGGKGIAGPRHLACKECSPPTTRPLASLEGQHQPHLTDGGKEAPRVKMACSRVTQPESGEGDSTQAF